MVGKDLAPKYQDANNLCQTILPSPEQSTCTKVEREVRNSDVSGASVLLATSEKTDCTNSYSVSDGQVISWRYKESMNDVRSEPECAGLLLLSTIRRRLQKYVLGQDYLTM